VVELYYGPKVAQANGRLHGIPGPGWKTNTGAGEPKQVLPTIPLAYRDHERVWQGTFLPDYPKPKPEMPVLLHLALVDAQYRGTIDAPPSRWSESPSMRCGWTTGASTSRCLDNGPVDFSGTMTAKKISGNVTHGGSSAPLTLSKATPASQASQ